MRLDSVLGVTRRETALFFASPIGYLFLAAFLGITLFVFFWGEAFFARNISDVRPMFEWLPVLLIFLAAAITMRSWSDERRLGTIEFILTLPVSTAELVVGKFLASMGLLLIALILTVPLPVTVEFLGDLDWGPVFAGYLAALLLGASYLSIGMFVSSKTENQIVALLLTAFACGVYFLLGSSFFTSLFSIDIADILRQFGAGSRFESITRGVLDLPDLYFYISVAATFLVLNAFALNSMGWAADGEQNRHRQAYLVVALLCGNILIANFWLGGMKTLRWDVTQGDQYSISEVTDQILGRLQEPMLIRGYFSSQSHPLLAPLVPQLKDLLKEYEVVGGGNVRVELVDPIEDPALEDEANSQYGIRPIPFQTADRHHQSLVNSYFDILIQYGDEYEVLGFRDLIEIKVQGESDIDLRLRNPEFDISRTIKRVIAGFQAGGTTFDYISSSLNFVGYVTDENQLPEGLVPVVTDLRSALDELKEESNGKFDWSLVDPRSGDGSIEQQIQEGYGFSPMATSLFDTETFYFYMTINDGETLVSVPLPDVRDVAGLKSSLEEGLKRFASGLLKGVALNVPVSAPQGFPQQQQRPGPQFGDLRMNLSDVFDVETASLDSDVPTDVDVLISVGPQSLSREKVFAIDQFLMRGGTVVIASGAFQTELTSQNLMAMATNTGLDDWLAHHGVTIEKSMVLDSQNSRFPVPQLRRVGGFTIREMVMADYPYFVDVRSEGLAEGHLATRELDQVTLAWSSPITIEEEVNAERAITTLISSSEDAWTEKSPNVMPESSGGTGSLYLPGSDQGTKTLAVALEGKFSSYFEESPFLQARADIAPIDLGDDGAEESADGETADDEAELPELPDTFASVIEHSPESARLIVIGSSDFVSDQTIRMLSSAQGTMYASPMQLFTNIVEWAVEDATLMSIRARGQYNRTLPPMSNEVRQFIEYGIYLITLIGLVLVFAVNWFLRSRRRAQDAEWLGDLT